LWRHCLHPDNETIALKLRSGSVFKDCETGRML
jgi:hypothetical protein